MKDLKLAILIIILSIFIALIPFTYLKVKYSKQESKQTFIYRNDRQMYGTY